MLLSENRWLKILNGNQDIQCGGWSPLRPRFTVKVCQTRWKVPSPQLAAKWVECQVQWFPHKPSKKIAINQYCVITRLSLTIVNCVAQPTENQLGSRYLRKNVICRINGQIRSARQPPQQKAKSFGFSRVLVLKKKVCRKRFSATQTTLS